MARSNTGPTVAEPAVSRRGFVATSLAVGFALAARPVSAETIITDSAGLDAGEVRIPTADGEIPGYRAMPAGGRELPTVLVVQEIFGVHEHIKDVCRRLAKEGYLAVAPELFYRQGDVSQLASIDEIRPIVAQVPDAQVMADLDAAVAWAVAEGWADPDRLAITGFCWGGRIVWLYAAHNADLDAGVAWYGRLVGDANERQPRHPVDVAAEIKAPVLGLYGGADQGIPLDTVERMAAAAATAEVPVEFQVYDEAPHAFFADYRPSYRKEAAEDGWRRMLSWFRQHGVG